MIRLTTLLPGTKRPIHRRQSVPKANVLTVGQPPRLLTSLIPSDPNNDLVIASQFKRQDTNDKPMIWYTATGQGHRHL